MVGLEAFGLKLMLYTRLGYFRLCLLLAVLSRFDLHASEAGQRHGEGDAQKQGALSLRNDWDGKGEEGLQDACEERGSKVGEGHPHLEDRNWLVVIPSLFTRKL